MTTLGRTVLGRTVLGVAATLTVLLATASPASAAYSDPLTTTGPLGLVWHATPAGALQALDDALPNVSANTVVADTNHPMTTCDASERAALPIAPTASRSLCWDDGDADNTFWTPQGITTSGDADDDGKWGADTIVLSGWHADTKDDEDPDNDARHNDARVAFINDDNPAAPSYRWVYLVDPNSTGSTFSRAEAHVGGMVWYGDKIYVSGVGTRETAIRVFSTKHILQLNSDAYSMGRTSAGTYAAYGYQYAMPQIGFYTYANGTCAMDSDTGIPCFSSISLDRSYPGGNSLVTTEYFKEQPLHGRLYRFDLADDDFLLSTDAQGNATSEEAYRSHVGNMQGVLAHDGTWYVAHSSATLPGQLWGQTTSASVSATCGADGTTACWARHPEALTYNVATGDVWSQTEWYPTKCATENQTCGRAIFSVPVTALP